MFSRADEYGRELGSISFWFDQAASPSSTCGGTM